MTMGPSPGSPPEEAGCFVCKELTFNFLVHRVDFSMEGKRPTSVWQKASGGDSFVPPQKLGWSLCPIGSTVRNCAAFWTPR